MSIDILELASEALQLPDAIDTAAERWSACGREVVKAEELLFIREGELLASGEINGTSEDRRKLQVRVATLDERRRLANAKEADFHAQREYYRLCRRHEALLVWAPILHAQKESR